MTPDYNEILLEAIDTVVLQRLSEINFDKTITCTVVDATNANEGSYSVSDGSRTFTAVSGNISYKKNDQVNVLIPMNDFSLQKTIVGKVNNALTGEPAARVSPWEKVVLLGQDFGIGLNKESIAAATETTFKLIGTITDTSQFNSIVGCNTICLAADFKTLMSNDNVIGGNYGLAVIIYTGDGENDKYVIKLDNQKDMFGNTYAYEIFTRQEQTYSMPVDTPIVKLDILLYQNNNFTVIGSDGAAQDWNRLPIQPPEGSDEPAQQPSHNIFIDNISIQFGYNIEWIEDNTVKIQTFDGLTYNNLTENDPSLQKNMSLIWYNKDNNNKYLGFTDGIFGSLNDASDPAQLVYYIKWERYLHNGEWEPFNTTGNEISIAVELNPIFETNKYRAIIHHQGNTYTSNELIFSAATGLDSNTVNALNMALTIHNKENSSLDNYPFYGYDQVITNPAETRKNREVYFSYDSSIGGSLESNVLEDATAYFYIPETATMLAPPGAFDYELKENEFSLKGHKAYKKIFTDEFILPSQDIKAFNLIKNSRPKELIGHGIGYEVDTIQDWYSDDETTLIQGQINDFEFYEKPVQGIRIKQTSSSKKIINIKQQLTGRIENGVEYCLKGSVYTLEPLPPNLLSATLQWQYGEAIQTSHIVFTTFYSGGHIDFNQIFSFEDVPIDADIYFIMQVDDVRSGTSIYINNLELTQNIESAWPYAENESEERREIARTFKYRIKDYYNPSFNNNKVILKIVDKNGHSYSTSKYFTFSSYGTSGTDYTLFIENALNKKASLYNANYELVQNIQGDAENVEWSMYPVGAYTTTNTSIGYNVAKLEVSMPFEDNKTRTLVALKPMEHSTFGVYYQGPTTIMYNSAGAEPQYSNGEIRLFYENTNEPLENGEWEIQYYERRNHYSMETDPISYAPSSFLYPQLSSRIDPVLIVPPLYTQDATSELYLVLEATQDGVIKWRQPLIIMQNQYSSTILNRWNESLQIDEKGSKVLAATICAGSKNEWNQFTGVVVGEVQTITDESEESLINNGILGFKNGLQTFGLTTNGTVFIGRPGAGQLILDGSMHATIQSGSWNGTLNFNGGIQTSTSEGGMCIALSTGEIDSTNFKLDKDGNITINGRITATSGDIAGFMINAPTTDGDSAVSDIMKEALFPNRLSRRVLRDAMEESWDTDTVFATAGFEMGLGLNVTDDVIGITDPLIYFYRILINSEGDTDNVYDPRHWMANGIHDRLFELTLKQGMISTKGQIGPWQYNDEGLINIRYNTAKEEDATVRYITNLKPDGVFVTISEKDRRNEWTVGQTKSISWTNLVGF